MHHKITIYLLQYIIVNNDSNDCTQDILQQYSHRMLLLNETKKGPAATRNRGILHAKNDIIAFTDSDCRVDSNWLREIIKPLSNPKIGMVGGKCLSHTNENSIEKFSERLLSQEDAINKYKPPYIATLNCACRRSLFNEIGVFDESFQYGEDCDFSYRSLQHGYKLTYQPAAIVYHHYRSTWYALMRQGYIHGKHAILVNSKHQLFLRTYGHNKVYYHPFTQLLKQVFQYICNPRNKELLYSFLFNSSKNVGKLMGIICFKPSRSYSSISSAEPPTS